MGPDVAHAGEAASYDIGAKVLYAFYTEGGQTDCFDFDPQTVLISTATCAATGDTSSHVSVSGWRLASTECTCCEASYDGIYV